MSTITLIGTEDNRPIMKSFLTMNTGGGSLI
jgi:hypothetical protein